jgi:hypothetical protein
MDTAALRSCHCCGLIQSVSGLESARCLCRRCETELADHAGVPRDNTLSAVLALTALLLYLPAAALPFLRISRLGFVTESSLVGGVISLLSEGHLFVGLVVLLFSILLPLLKLSLLLVLSLRSDWLAAHHRGLTYRLIEHLGRWGMLDVLLVAVMIAFIKLGTVVSFGAGIGLPLFASFVVLSLMAGVAFNPHSLWSEAVSVPTPSPTPEAVIPPTATPGVPTAKPKPSSRRTWLWLLPVSAALLMGWIAWQWSQQRGRVIEIAFRDGHGVAVGNELRHLGIPVGRIDDVQLDRSGEGILVKVRLSPDADHLARQGTRFWIVRPQVDLTGVAGLETIVGAKYLALRPGPDSGTQERKFVGLEEPPLEDLDEPGGIEIVLQSPTARGVRAGLGLYFRHLRVGGVKSVALSGDGGAVEALVYVRPQYAFLIRPKSKFWNAAGVNLTGSLTAFHLHVGPAETWVRGGIEMAVPPDAGEPVQAGHRFDLSPSAEKEWLTWSPALTDGHRPTLFGGPVVRAATLRSTQDGWLWDKDQSRQGRLVVTDKALFGLTELLERPAGTVGGTSRLEVGETSVSLDDHKCMKFGDTGQLAWLDVEGLSGTQVNFQQPRQPENGYVVTGEAAPRLVPATRLTEEGRVWKVSSEVNLPADSHGAPFVAESSGAIIGIVRIRDDATEIIPIPSGSPPK